ncbi:uncharacterized protein LOC115953395 [Quercus lobata]|uniref:uncharacterized protein LOC115953395 n=1 Tax=Quercus lobata TaxID=97700 RepID=UPI001243DAEF|nr:uncharacterized protein LOC115953395 [Quercus lobata]
MDVLEMELHNTKKGNNTITEYLQRIKEFRDKLAAVTIEVDDEELLHIILKGLLKEYNPFCSAIRTRSDALEDLELLHSEKQSIKYSAEDDNDPNSMAMLGSTGHKPGNSFDVKQKQTLVEAEEEMTETLILQITTTILTLQTTTILDTATTIHRE